MCVKYFLSLKGGKVSNEKMLVQMKFVLEIGKENHLSLETYIISNSHNLKRWSEKLHQEHTSLSPAHSGMAGEWILQTSFSTLPTIRNLLPWADDTTTRVLQGATAQLPGLQLSRQVWRIREDSKQLHTNDCSKQPSGI